MICSCMNDLLLNCQAGASKAIPAASAQRPSNGNSLIKRGVKVLTVQHFVQTHVKDWDVTTSLTQSAGPCSWPAQANCSGTKAAWLLPKCVQSCRHEAATPDREVKRTGKSNGLGNQMDWEVKWTGKSNGLGSQMDWEVNWTGKSFFCRMYFQNTNPKKTQQEKQSLHFWTL